MKYYLLIPFLIFLCGCTLKKGSQSSVKSRKSIAEKIQGCWTLINNDEFFEITDIFSSDYIFEKDSAFTLHIPMELKSRAPYHIKGDSINLNGMPYFFRCNKDTLKMYYEDEWYGLIQYTYLKSKIDHKLLSRLKNDTLNYPLLVGKWI